MKVEDKQMGVDRLKADKREPLSKLGIEIFKRVLGRWRFLIIVRPSEFLVIKILLSKFVTEHHVLAVLLDLSGS
jgi:hypothetical protein